MSTGLVAALFAAGSAVSILLAPLAQAAPNGAFAVAATAAPPIAVFAGHAPTAPLAQCPAGEGSDQLTGVCVPHTAPNSPFVGIPGNPSMPAVRLPGGGGAIPCTGANTGECIGLAEEDGAMGPLPVPRSTFDSSPTITGHIGPE